MYRILPHPFHFHFIVHCVFLVSLYVGKKFKCLQHLVIFMTCARFLMLCKDSIFQNHFLALCIEPSPTQFMFCTSQHLVYFQDFFLVKRTQHHSFLHTNLISAHLVVPHLHLLHNTPGVLQTIY